MFVMFNSKLSYERSPTFDGFNGNCSIVGNQDELYEAKAGRTKDRVGSVESAGVETTNNYWCDYQFVPMT